MTDLLLSPPSEFAVDEPAGSVQRTAYLLLLSAGLTAVAGLGYWTLASHVYSPVSLGRASAFVSALLAVGGIGQLNLHGALTRYLPRAGAQGSRLILRAYGASTVATALLALAVGVTLGQVSPGFGYFRQWGWLLFFIGGCVTWSVFTLQDSCLTAVGAAAWVPVENLGYAVVKVGMLGGFALVGFDSGVAVSWVVPAALLCLPLNVILLRRLRRPVAAQAGPVSAVSRRFLAMDFGGSLAGWSTVLLLPVLVVAGQGLGTNATFGVCLALTGALDLVAVNLATSLTVHVAGGRSARAQALRVCLTRTAALVVPAVVVLILARDLVLRVFGAHYASGATLLIWLALATLPRAVVNLAIGFARATDDARSLLVLPLVTNLGVLALAVPGALLGSPAQVGAAVALGQLPGCALAVRALRST